MAYYTKDKPPDTDGPLKPDDYSDVGQAKVLVARYHACLRYTKQTGYLYYDQHYWIESALRAQKCVQELTEAQLAEAEDEVAEILVQFSKTGALDLLFAKNPATNLTDPQKKLQAKYKSADAYRKFVLRRRNTNYISAALKEAAPMLEIQIEELDADEFFLNTPAGTIDLRKGLEGLMPHRAEDYITKITAVSPGIEGKEEWKAFLQTICCNDQELEDYIQQVCGLAAIGKVYVEALVIAIGSGRNGKSTFFNTIARVLGSYSGNLSADVLTQECHRNAKPELAELRGKRLIIAAELKSDTRLSDSTVKQLCSTDQIYAEKKYHAPFSFSPCHTLILYTNHLPAVTASDDGTWRRLIVIPFTAKIEGSADIKNYADHLYHTAGPAILAWIVEGAKTVIDNQYQLTPPPCVTDAIANYRQANDWFAQFLESCCSVGEDKSVNSADLYRGYRSYCESQCETAQSTTAFYRALDSAGYKRVRRSGRSIITGLYLKYN